MVHVVFQTSDVHALQKAIELDESLQGEIVEIQDELAVGPLKDIYTEEGVANRIEWWRNVLEFSPYTDSLNIVDDRKKFNYIKEKLDEGEFVWIWMAQNQHDVCCYYWLISQLKNYQGKVFVLYLNNLPFINEKGNIFYPIDLFQIQPKEFTKAKKLARAVTLSEFEVDPDEWRKLCEENSLVRILEGGKKIVGKDDSYYDKNIFNALSAEPQKIYKVLHQLFSKDKLHTGDVFLVWRIRELINEGILEVIGDWSKGWKEVEVKLKSSAPIAAEINNEPA